MFFGGKTDSGPNSLSLDITGLTSDVGSDGNKENVSPDVASPIFWKNPSQLVNSLQEQVRILRRAADVLVKQNSGAKDAVADDVSDKDRDTFESDAVELQEQIVKLKCETFLYLKENLFIFYGSVGLEMDYLIKP